LTHFTLEMEAYPLLCRKPLTEKNLE
jgi:hypothetical protein